MFLSVGQPGYKHKLNRDFRSKGGTGVSLEADQEGQVMV